MTPFAVTSTSFALYKAFKEECEKMGWKLTTDRTFNEERMKICNCMYFDKDWGGSITPPMMAMSNTGSSTVTFSLGSQYDEALAFAKEQIKPKGMRSAEEVVSGHRYAVDAVKTYATEAMQFDRAGLIAEFTKRGYAPLTEIINNHPLPELP